MIDIRSKTRWVTFFDAHFSVVIFFHYFLILSLFFSGIVFFATFSKNCTLTRAQQITEPGAIQPLEKIFCSLFRLSAFFFFFAFRNKAQKNLRFLTWMANPHREEANQSSLYPARKNDQIVIGWFTLHILLHAFLTVKKVQLFQHQGLAAFARDCKWANFRSF